MTKRQRTTEKLFSKAFEILSECPAPSKNGPKLVGTHDGTFHCDEALGCAMLQAPHLALAALRACKPDNPSLATAIQLGCAML